MATSMKYTRGGLDQDDNQSASTTTYEEDSIEMSEIQSKYQGVNQQSTEMSSSRGDGRAPTRDLDLDETNKYMDDDDDDEDIEGGEDDTSSEDDTQIATEEKNEIDEVKEQYDRQLGELYKQQREKALKMREAKVLQKQKRQPTSPSKEMADQNQSNIQKKQNDFVQDCKKWFEADPQPSRLGNFYCTWYNKTTNEPRIVLGPDWVFSLVEFLVINGICGYFLYTMDNVAHPILYQVGWVLLVFQNISFMATVLVNPGLPPRDISIHSQSYINKVKIFKSHLYCNICKVIYREGKEGTEHCPDCGFCVESLDHHCPWSSKCIGGGNMTAFKFFLGSTVTLMIFLFTGGMLVVASQ